MMLCSGGGGGGVPVHGIILMFLSHHLFCISCSGMKFSSVANSGAVI